MPQIEIAKNQIYNNATIECAHITISSADGTQVYRFRNLFEAENDYTSAVDYSWQMVARANGNKSITITVGSGTNSSHTFALTTTFTQFTHVYQGIVASEYPFVDMQLPVGEYWFYHVQLEKGNVVTDWHPHLDDGVDIAMANTTEQIKNVNQTIKNWVTFYDSEFTKTDEAITAHARRITANENNLTEIRQTTEAQFQVQADRISGIVSDVETLDDKVDNNYSQLSQTATDIQAKVTSIETFVGGDTVISGSTLQQEANRISTEVSESVSTRISSDTVNTALNNLEIGGENLLDGSDDFSGWSFSSNVAKLDDKDNDGSTIVQWNTVSTLSWRELRSKPQPYSLIKNRKVTVSFWVRSQDYASIQALTSGGISCYIGLCTGDSTTRTKYRNIIATTRSITDEWIKLDGTATITDDWFTSGSGTIDKNTRFFVQVYNYTIYRIQVKKVQLEYGDYSTEWSPQPGDYRSSFEQTAQEISLKVSKNNIISEINQQAEQISINAGKINLNGAVTANNNVTIGTDGKITAKAGYIGNGTSGFTIGNTAIYNGVTSMSDTAHNGVYVGTDGIRLGKGVFNVTNTGALTASNATITGMNGSISIKDSSNRVIFSASNSGIQANTIQNNTLTTLLSVGTSGSGTFAGWSFNKDAIYRTNPTQGNENGMYFGVNGLSIKDKFKVDSQGNLTASNATLTGGSITIKNGTDNIFYVSSSGMNVYKGSISLGNGAFYVDSNGNAYVNTIHVRSSGTSDSTSKDMFYIGSRPSTVDGVTINDSILPSSYDQKTLMCKTMLAENLVARNITITGGSVNISNNDHGADGLYSYINLGYGWFKDNQTYRRTTQLTSNGCKNSLNQYYGTSSQNPPVGLNQVTELYSYGIKSEFDYWNTLSDSYEVHYGAYLDSDKISATMYDKNIFTVYLTGTHKNEILIGNTGIPAVSRGSRHNLPTLEIAAQKTYLYGDIIVPTISTFYVGQKDDNSTLLKWINSTVVDDSTHSFTKAITSSNSFQITKTISSTAYNSLNVNNNVTQEVYSGKAANILFGRGNDTNPSGGVRFLDSVTLPNGNPASVSSGTGTRVYDGTTLKTLKQFVIDNAPAPSGSDNNFTNEYKNYLDMLASTSSTTGVSRINLGSADTIYVGSSRLSAYVSSAASSAASGKMASTGSSSTVTFSGTTTLSGTTYIPSATRIGTSSSYKTLSDYITWSATSTSGAPSGKYVITTKLEALFKAQTSNNTVYKVTSCQAYKLGEMVIMSIWLQRQSGYTGNTSVNIDLSAAQYSPLRPLTTAVTAMGSQNGGGCGAIMFTSGYVLQFRFPTPPSTANSYYYQANLVYRSENTTALNTYYS